MANLKPEQFLTLMERVEEQGGVHIKDHCVPRRYVLKVPTPDGYERKRSVYTTGCGQDSRFVIPYGEGGNLIACANDDRMDLWPRFQA